MTVEPSDNDNFHYKNKLANLTSLLFTLPYKVQSMTYDCHIFLKPITKQDISLILMSIPPSQALS